MPRRKTPKASTADRSARVTIVDVAKRAGVHWSTVSRALNPQKRHLISPDMIERVEACVRELGYRPNALASGLRTQRSRTIGVIVSNLGDPAHPPIVRAIEDRFAEIGYVTLVGNTDNYPERQAALIDRFIAQGVDGLIVATFARNDPIIGSCVEANIPTVAVFRDPECDDVPSVRVDDAKAVELAVQHLAAHGHRRIAHIAGPQNVSTGYYRHRGFRRACRALVKLGVVPSVVYGTQFTVEDGEIACRMLLRDHPDITAIAAANDMLAVGALRYLKSCDIHCPNDISIVGMNDMPFMDSIAPALTTIRTPTADLGDRAAAILIAMINGTPIESRRVVLQPELVVRGSVARLREATQRRYDHLAEAPQ
ncbi:LacI family DNA-binding transcriptional regulator [Bradyrhizobium sp. STM 3562]|uniref:LacI family DNA-binding transcriptional regulator n=1 Tax=Bradyrhizobium sp. STM 3562 TaxID=578924 RepID=UPI00388E753C